MRRFLMLGLILSVGCLDVVAKKELTPQEQEEAERVKQEKREKEQLKKKQAEQKKLKKEFDYTFNDVSSKLVIVVGSSSSLGTQQSGSGFIAKMNGKTYLFTNQHIIMGMDKISFKTADGVSLRPRGVELSLTRDIARLRLADDVDALEIGGNMAIDSPVAVFGNSEGSGVSTELYGKVKSVSSELVEVSADFVSGNSGSPVLNQDQKVIAIASFVRTYKSSKDKKKKSGKKSDDEEGESKVRRFCYRLTDVEWKPVNWKKYNAKYGELYNKSQQLVGSVFGIVIVWSNDPLAYVDAENHPDSDVRKWAVSQKYLADHFKKRSKSLKQMKKDLRDSAGSLAMICSKRARQMHLLASQKELTGFLKDQFSQFGYNLEYISELLEEVRQKI